MGFDVPKKEIGSHLKIADSTLDFESDKKSVDNSSNIIVYSDTIHRLVETAEKCTPEQIELAIQVLKNFSDKNK